MRFGPQFLCPIFVLLFHFSSIFVSGQFSNCTEQRTINCKCTDPVANAAVCLYHLNASMCAMANWNPPQAYQCPSNNICIHSMWIMDGKWDCPQGEDENCTNFGSLNPGNCSALAPTTIPATTTTLPATTTTAPTTTTTAPATTTTRPATTTTTAPATTTTAPTTTTTMSTMSTTTSKPITTPPVTTTTAMTTAKPTTPVPPPPVGNKVSVVFIFDGTPALNPLKSVYLFNTLTNFTKFVAPNEANRIYNYMLVTHTPTDVTIFADVPTFSTFLTTIANWANTTAAPVNGTCGQTNIVMLITKTLPRATKGCSVMLVVTSNTQPLDQATKFSLMDTIAASMCQIDIVVFDNGCITKTQDTYLIYQTICDLTGGMLYLVTLANANQNLPAIFVIFGYEALNPQILLEYEDKKVAGTYTVRVSVDSGLQQILAVWTGCNITKDIRDNRGVSLVTMPTINTNHFITSDQLHGTVIMNLANTSVWSTTQSGPGNWVFTVKSTCPPMFKISAIGTTDFTYKFSTNAPNATMLSQPLLGVSQVVTMSLLNPKSPLYTPLVLKYVTLYGTPTDSSNVVKATLTTKGYLAAPNDPFFIKITGTDPNNYMFQRYSQNAFFATAIDVKKQIQSTFCAANQFDCTGTGPCIDFGAYHDTKSDCPSGSDESCLRGYFKCNYACIPVGQTCSNVAMDKLCTNVQLKPSDSFNCSNGFCIPTDWVGDNDNDCLDDSDENPIFWNECTAPNKSLIIHKCTPGAVCTKIPDSSYYCTCPVNYWGDGFNCALKPPTPPPPTQPTAQVTMPITTAVPTTAAPTTTAPKTAAPTTAAPTTAAPTTAAPTTAAPTTAAPTTAAPTTTAPKTAAPTTAAPTTAAPTTAAPTTAAPTTTAPKTAAPTTAAPTTAAPITTVPTTVPPTTTVVVTTKIITNATTPLATTPVATTPMPATTTTSLVTTRAPTTTMVTLAPTTMLAATTTTMMSTSTATTTKPTTTQFEPLIPAIWGGFCMPGQFDCGANGTMTNGTMANSARCLYMSKYRDCRQDCSNGLDEQCFIGQVKCDGCKCVAPADAPSQCMDRRVQGSCNNSTVTGIFNCKDGNGCIYFQWAMDGIPDCKDGSDENPMLWNECLLGRYTCDKLASCFDDTTNPPKPDGRYQCQCPLGYTTNDNGKTCISPSGIKG